MSCEDHGYKVRKDGLKHCNYCGSLEPEELAGMIKEGEVILKRSDWKYGWPHKFYVNKVDGSYVGKFYTRHLQELDEEKFAEVAPIISEASGINWSMREGKLHWAVPNYEQEGS